MSTKAPTKVVKVTGCDDCLLATSEGDALVCGADLELHLPLDPDDTDKAASALPSACPLWKNSLLIQIDHRDVQTQTGVVG